MAQSNHKRPSRNWLGGRKHRRRQLPSDATRRRRCNAERLEQRLVLAAVFWDGDAGNSLWHDPLNWDSDSLPTLEDTVTIDVPGDLTIRFTQDAGSQSVKSLRSLESLAITGGNLTLAEPSEVFGSFSLTGGTVAGDGDLTLHGVSNLSSSSQQLVTIDGPGKLIAAAEAQVDIFVNARIRRVLQNFGTVDVQGNGSVTFGGAFAGGIRITNEAGAQFTIHNGVNLSAGGHARLLNLGTLTKTGPGTTEFTSGNAGNVPNSLFLDNQGTLVLEGGELKLSGRGSSTTVIDVPAETTLTLNSDFVYAQPVGLTAAGTVNFEQGTHDFTGSQFVPTGTVQFNGGTVTLENAIDPTTIANTIDGAVNFNVDQSLNSVTLTGRLGGSGDLTLSGTTTLSQPSGESAFLEGSGRVIIPADATVDAFNGTSMRRVVENFGTFTLLATNSISIGVPFTSGPILINHQGAEFHLVSAASFFASGQRSFVNKGTLTKSGSGTSTFPIFFPSLGGAPNFLRLENEGDLVLLEGELDLRGGFSSTKMVDVPAEATLSISATPHSGATYAAPVAITGAGTINFDGGSHDFTGTEFLASGRVNFNLGTVTIANPLRSTDLGTIRGAVIFNADQTLESIDLVGSLDGSGNLTLAGTTTLSERNFTSATLQGSGKLIIPAGATVDVNNSTTIKRLVENFGTFNLLADRSFTLGVPFTSGPIFFNRPGASFNVTSDPALNPGGERTIVNEGVFTKSGIGNLRFPFTNAGGSRGSLQLENQGALRILAGSVEYDLPALDVAGSVELSEGTLWDVGGDVTITGTLSGAGTVVGDVVSSGIIAPGDPLGKLMIDGAFTQTADGVLVVQLGGRVENDNFDQLQVTGAATLDGRLTVELADAFLPGIADQFVILRFASASGDFAAVEFADISPFELEHFVGPDQIGLTVDQQEGTGLTPTFRGTADSGTTVAVTANGVTLGATTADSQGRWSLRVPEQLTDERYFVTVTGTGSPAFDLAESLSLGERPAPDLSGLALHSERIEFFPFGADRDGVLAPTDVIVTATNAELAIQNVGLNASGVVGLAKRTYVGELLLDQESPGDDAPDYSLINENLISEYALASVLPVAIRELQVRNIDTSNGFSADFFAVGAFGEIDLAGDLAEEERAAREAIRLHLKENTNPDIGFITAQQDRWGGYEIQPAASSPISAEGEDTGQSFQVIVLEDGLLQRLTNVSVTDLDKDQLIAAIAVIREGLRFEADLQDKGTLPLYEGDDARGQQYQAILAARAAAAQRIVQQSVSLANVPRTPTAEQFEFVEQLLTFAVQAETYVLGVDSSETLIALAPAIELEITRLQFEAQSQREINDAVNHAVISALASSNDAIQATFETAKGFIDQFILRVETFVEQLPSPVTQNSLNTLSLQLANTAVSLGINLLDRELIEANSAYGPDMITSRIRQLVSDFIFDPNNVLPEQRVVEASNPPTFILLGDLPLNDQGELTTDGVTDLFATLPPGLVRFIPQETEFEFSFAIRDGGLVPLDLPTLTLGFVGLEIAEATRVSGFVSVGSYGVDGEFERGNFAGGIDVLAEIDGVTASVGVTLNGLGEDRGFFPDADGTGGRSSPKRTSILISAPLPTCKGSSSKSRMRRRPLTCVS